MTSNAQQRLRRGPPPVSRTRRASAVGVAVVAALSSCGLSVVGTGVDEGSSPGTSDAATDRREIADAAAPTPSDARTFLCGTTAVATCAGCEAGAAACPTTGTCVSDCRLECADASLGCVACSGGLASGFCEAVSPASCITNPEYEHCGCAVASDCAGANQVCVLGECRSCGEPMTDGEVCRSGTGMKKCKADDPKPENRFRCR